MPISATRTRPQCIRPGSNRCAGLRRKNVTVSVAWIATPITAPVVPLMPLGRSTAENRRAVGVDRLDHVERIALHRPVEAGAEQRIDDQRRLADRLRIERQHRMFPSARRGGRVALQAVALAQQDDRDLAAARGEFGRRHKTVAAIVAAAGDHQDRPLLHQIHRGFGDRLPGAQHQREAGRAGGNGRAGRHAPFQPWSELPCQIPRSQAPFPEAYSRLVCAVDPLTTAHRLS